MDDYTHVPLKVVRTLKALDTAEFDAVCQDAELYRWLRDTGAVFTVRAGGCEGDACVLADIGRPAVGLDVAIKAAMAARLTVGAA